MVADGALSFPMVGVNDTNTKHMFDNRYGTGQSSFDAIMRSTNVLLAGLTVVVAGYGYCGKGLAQRAAGLGANVIVTEVDPIKGLDATMQGFQVMKMSDAAALGDVFVTATSNVKVLTNEHFAMMKDGAILTNAGHFDVEVDVKGLKEMAVESSEGVRHATTEYVLPSGKRVYLIAEGRLVNLAAAEGHPASVMDMSFSDQALTAEWLKDNGRTLDPVLHEVPEHIDRQVARLKLASMGIEIDEMTAEQRSYVTSWQHGS
jgi:adenosylhomocysteinase